MRKRVRFRKLLEDGLIDLAVEVMHQLEDPIRSQFLMRERYVVIIGAEHPEGAADGSSRTDEPIDIDLYCRLSHALHSFVGGTTGNVDAALAAIGRKRHVALSAPHFLTIVKAVAESRIIATVPERLARRVASIFGIRIYRAPIDLAPISLGMVWHRRSDSDPAQTWFRQQVLEAAQRMG
jgi:DNA-binding transcriptional LysR family regulator